MNGSERIVAFPASVKTGEQTGEESWSSRARVGLDSISAKSDTSLVTKIEDALLRTAFWHTERALAALDDSGVIRTWSAGARTLTGIESRDALGQRAEKIFSSPEEFRGLWSELRKGRPVRNSRVSLRARNGTVIASTVNLTPLPDAGGYLLAFDIGLAGENGNGTKGDCFLRLERFGSIGRMTASFAHDMRSPLHVITSAAETVLEDMPGSAPLRGDMEAILRNAKVVSESLSALLDFAKTPSVRLKPGKLDQVVKQALALVETRRRKQGIRLKQSLGRLPSIPMNAGMLRGVFYNILVNSLEAMPAGGSLTVKSGVGRTGAWVEVRDSGRGLPRSLMSRIGTPFFTTKSGGIVLGLYAAQEIVRQHRAKMSFSPAKPKGTCVRVSFPEAKLR